MGSSQKGLWTGRVRSGYGQYFMGTSPLYLAASAVFRLFKPPVLYGSVAMLWGYFSSLARGLPRYDDPAFRRFLRRYQRQCLLRGKRAATRRLNEAQAPVWRARGATPPTPSTRSSPGELLGLPFDRLTMPAAVERCMQWCLGPRAPRTVITANAAILCMMRRDPELREACRRGDLILADGMSVVWTSRFARIPLPERVAGADLMARLLEAGAERRLKAFFLGARPEVVAELARRCARDYPGLVVAGFRDGYFGRGEQEGLVEEIRAAAPHMLFVGMPSPFKETWCERHRAALDVPIVMGVGGSFDVLAGYVPRAPRLVQSLGLEWSWRLAMEPRKLWKRYLVTNSEYLWLAAGEILKHRIGLAGRAGL
jgi:N-acetylglucosaminyldiphosphoundecaprenol N-acetyl-beta-D-mannosaminyltransferase